MFFNSIFRNVTFLCIMNTRTILYAACPVHLGEGGGGRKGGRLGPLLNTLLNTLKDCSRIRPCIGCFPLCQRFRKFRSEYKWIRQFRFLLSGIFRITSGGGPLISVEICRQKFAIPSLTNRFFVLIKESGK